MFHRTFKIGERTLPTQYLLSASAVYGRSHLSAEELNAMKIWVKSLFDTNSEGIEDTILR